LRFLLTRFEPSNDLHCAMFEAFGKVFGDRVCKHPIEHTRAVEQSGRFLASVYEIDYRNVTRETWRRARATFDAAYDEFKGHLVAAWDRLDTAEDAA
jgi:cellulose biosynthesis protein BcsQ